MKNTAWMWCLAEGVEHGRGGRRARSVVEREDDLGVARDRRARSRRRPALGGGRGGACEDNDEAHEDDEAHHPRCNTLFAAVMLSGQFWYEWLCRSTRPFARSALVSTRTSPTASRSRTSRRAATGCATARELGAKIWLKRDDHTGSELMGNKVRKLEYLMAEAVARPRDPRDHVRRRAVQPRARDRVRRGAARHEERADPAHRRSGARRRAPTGNILLDRARRRRDRVDLAARVARSQPAARRAGGARARGGRHAVRRARGRLERARQLGLHPRDARARR